MPSTDLERFAGRTFSFYPPILNVEHNDWTFVEASWAEILVRNQESGLELWIPRRFLGEISQVEKPVMIVGLDRELEFSGGMVTPHHRQVIEMPGKSSPPPRPGAKSTPPPSSGDSPTEKRLGRLILGVLALAILGTVVVVLVSREGQSGGRIEYRTVLQANLGLTAKDDYFAVKRKLGPPAEERWKPHSGERKYQALSYPKLGVTIILMGVDERHMEYIGAKDKDWKNVASVKLPGGGDTSSILRALSRF